MLPRPKESGSIQENIITEIKEPKIHQTNRMTSTSTENVSQFGNGLPTISNSKMDTTDNPSFSMNSEKNRLDTFRNWSIEASVTPESLAKAGFYYTGHDTEVVCFSCGLRVGQWSYNDTTIEKHRRFNSNCNFLSNQSDNIPYVAPTTSRTVPYREISHSSTTKPLNISRGTCTESSTVLQNLIYRHPEASEINYSLIIIKLKEQQRVAAIYQTRRESPMNRPRRICFPQNNSSNILRTSNSNGIYFAGPNTFESPYLHKEQNTSTGPQLNNSTKGIFINVAHGRGATVGCQEMNNPIARALEVNSRSSTSGNIFVNGAMEHPVSTGVSNGKCNGIPEERSSKRGGIEQMETSTSDSPTYSPSLSRTTRPENRMYYEEERFKTFLPNWPMLFLNPRDLAKAGFYYLQIADRVRCAFCPVVLNNWAETDVPLAVHHMTYPMCPFLTERDVENVPLNSKIPYAMIWDGQDEYGPNSYEEFVLKRKRRVPPEEAGSVAHKGPIHVSQVTIDARLRSFMTWPSWSPMKPQELAEAGFFYTGMRDYTNCFYCDVVLLDWLPWDDAWGEHGRLSKNCAYVMLLKGQEFIKSCQVENGLQSVVVQGVQQHLQAVETEPPSPYDAAVNEAMMSFIVQNVLKSQNVLKAETYPSDLVRNAILRKFRDTGCGVKNVTELDEAVMVEKEEWYRTISMTALTSTGTSLPVSPSDEQTTSAVWSTATTQKENLSESVVNEIQLTKHETEISPEEELKQIKANRLCKICLDREIEVVFLPCGHLIACRQCALARKDCAICRGPVTSVLRAFLP